MLLLKVESTDRTIRQGGAPKRRGALRSVLAAGLLAALAGCASGLAVTDGTSAMDIRDRMTTDDRHIAEVAVQVAMERRGDNEASTWSNGMSGNHGAVVPRQTYRSRAGAYCRRYDEMVTVAGVTATFAQTACRNGLGVWTKVT